MISMNSEFLTDHDSSNDALSTSQVTQRCDLKLMMMNSLQSDVRSLTETQEFKILACYSSKYFGITTSETNVISSSTN
jgi:hypothetical protein